MPGRDQTGPCGKGAMTGRRLGDCVPENQKSEFFRNKQGRGIGQSRGFAFRGNFGRRPVDDFNQSTEDSDLRAELRGLRQQISELMQKITEKLNL